MFGCIVPCGNVFFFNNFVSVDQIHPIQANKRTIYLRYNFDGPCTHRRIVGLLFVDCGHRSRNFWSLQRRKFGQRPHVPLGWNHD